MDVQTGMPLPRSTQLYEYHHNTHLKVGENYDLNENKSFIISHLDVLHFTNRIGCWFGFKKSDREIS